MRSLRARVALVVLLAFIPAFIVVYAISRGDRSEARDDGVEETHALAANVSDQYDLLVTDTRTLLREIAAVQPSRTVLAQCSDALAAIARQSPVYENILVIRENGLVVCSARPFAARVDTSASPWLATAFNRGEFVGLARAPGTSDDGMFTVALAGENANGRFVVAARVALDALASVVGDVESASDSSITIVDGTDRIVFQRPHGELIGRVLADKDLADRFRQRDPDGAVTADGPDDVERVYTATQLGEPARALVLAGVPTDALYDSVDHAFRVRAVMLLVAAVLATAVALAFAHLSVIRRIRGLVTMTRQIANGDLHARSNVKSNDEIGELGRSLDAMAGELHEREIERTQLLGAIVEASEEERKRIAGDVHDDSIQVMSAHVMNLQLLRRRVDDPELQQRIRELEDSGRAATARLRDLVFELHSPTLEEHGLEAAVETLLDRAFEGEDVECRVTSVLEEQPPLATAATAYRIAQEAVRNARQHARPKHVRVDIGRDNDELVLRVVDDGRGFAPATVADRPGHLGLRGMRERAAAVGGTLDVESETGCGTTITCRLPWLVVE